MMAEVGGSPPAKSLKSLGGSIGGSGGSGMAKSLKSLKAEAEVKTSSIRRGQRPAAPLPRSIEMAVTHTRLGVFGEWSLWRRDTTGTADWDALVLERACRARKRKWYLGWNGERLARNADTAHLHGNHAEILEWVRDTLTGRA